VVKGPAGADIGRGSTSGYINLVSKLPSLEEATGISYTVGSADMSRLTADVNRKIDDSSAFRFNFMQQQSGVADRDFVENNSVGVAPSIAFGLGTPTRVYLYGQHVEQDNVPDGGIPTIGMEGFYANPSYNHDASNSTPNQQTAEGNALAAAYQRGRRVDRTNFYGSAADREKVRADMVTLKIETDLSEKTVLTNTSRYGKTDWERVITGVNGPSLTTLTVGTYPSGTFTQGANYNDPNNSATWTAARSVQGTDQVNEILANLTNIKTSFETGGIKHDLATGLELMQEVQRNNTLSTVTVPPANLYNPNPYDAFVRPVLTGAYTEGEARTAAVYVLDTMHLTDRFDLSAGLRFDSYKLEAAKNAAATLSDNGNLWGWKLGALYKPADNGSVYLAVASSETPPGSFSSGNTPSFLLDPATASSTNNPRYEPQETTNVELGTKWDVLEKRLALTAAIYQTDNENEVTYEPLTSTYSQEGKTRVKGIELGAAGQVTSAWQISAGVAYMDAEALEAKSFSSTNGVTNNDGGGVRWTPEWSGTLWTTYRLTNAFTVGGGARYVGEQKRLITPGVNPATQNMPEIPDYWVVDAMASYRVQPNLTVRGNVYNVLDEEYIALLNNGGSRMTLGTPLTAAMTLDFQF
jgi:catecholate siderophore receptor